METPLTTRRCLYSFTKFSVTSNWSPALAEVASPAAAFSSSGFGCDKLIMDSGLLGGRFLRRGCFGFGEGAGLGFKVSVAHGFCPAGRPVVNDGLFCCQPSRGLF